MTEVKKRLASKVWRDADNGITDDEPSKSTVSRLKRARKAFQNGQKNGEIASKIGWSVGLVAQVRQWWLAYEKTHPRQEREETLRQSQEEFPGPQIGVGLEGLWPVTSSATIPFPGGYRPIGQAGKPTLPVTITAFRFRVSNDGRGAAEHVAGTLEFDGIERRICWYEGNVPYIDINEHDHSYLDVYGVILNPQNSPTTEIVMPTEHGWDNLQPRTLKAPLEVSLRVTAANARPQTTRFSIDPAQGCRPIGR